MASTLVDLVKIIITNTGTATLQLGSAVNAFRGQEALIDGNTYSYSIQQGSNYEAGTGVFSAGDQTLTRGVIMSSYGNGPIPLAPNAVLTFPALARDFPGPPGPPGVPGDPGTAGPPGPPGAAAPVFAYSANHTLGLGDVNKFLVMDLAAPGTLTLPLNADVAGGWPDGAVVGVMQGGDGTVTFTPAAGVTLVSRGGALVTTAIYAVAQVKYISLDTWVVMGDVVP